jgi:hypothetical protein
MRTCIQLEGPRAYRRAQRVHNGGGGGGRGRASGLPLRTLHKPATPKRHAARTCLYIFAARLLYFSSICRHRALQRMLVRWLGSATHHARGRARTHTHTHTHTHTRAHTCHGARVLGRPTLRLEKRLGVGIAAHPHDVQLVIGPLVQLARPHKGDVHTHAAVHGRAVQADENTIGNRGPRRVPLAAVKAGLQRGGGRGGVGGTNKAEEKRRCPSRRRSWHAKGCNTTRGRPAQTPMLSMYSGVRARPIKPGLGPSWAGRGNETGTGRLPRRFDVATAAARRRQAARAAPAASYSARQAPSGLRCSM